MWSLQTYRLFLAAVPIVLGGCRAEWEDVGTAHVGAVVDELEVGETVTIEAQGQLDVFVVHPCAGDREPVDDCSVDVEDDGTIEIHSVFSLLRRDPNDSCAESVISHCVSPAIPAGSHPMIFGPSEGQLEVPSEFEPFILEGFERD